MSEAFLGEIRIVSFNFAPRGWALCNGQILPINQNQALFSLLGTMYGGNGQTNFALPNFQGRVPIHMGNGFIQGQLGGAQAHTISISELPTHTHTAQASTSNGDTVIPVGGFLGGVSNMYTGAANLVALTSATVTSVGGSQAHENMQPYLTLNFTIALQGIFPSQN